MLYACAHIFLICCSMCKIETRDAQFNMEHGNARKQYIAWHDMEKLEMIHGAIYRFTINEFHDVILFIWTGLFIYLRIFSTTVKIKVKNYEVSEVMECWHPACLMCSSCSCIEICTVYIYIDRFQCSVYIEPHLIEVFLIYIYIYIFRCRIIEEVLKICSGHSYLVFLVPPSMQEKQILHIVL